MSEYLQHINLSQFTFLFGKKCEILAKNCVELVKNQGKKFIIDQYHLLHGNINKILVNSLHGLLNFKISGLDFLNNTCPLNTHATHIL